MKYKETGPQESILSRDNYSTSHHPSMISGPPIRPAHRVRNPGLQTKQPKVTEQDPKYLDKLGENFASVKQAKGSISQTPAHAAITSSRYSPPKQSTGEAI